MKKPLLNVVFASEKRKQVLLLLQEGPKEMEDLLKSLGTSRQNLLSQTKILEDNYLIDHSNDIYELTSIGKVVADEVVPLSNLIEVFDVDIDYWGSRNLDFIPPSLLARIYELGKCEIITPDHAGMFQVHDQFHEVTKESKSLYAVTSFFYPHFPEIFSEVTSHDTNVNVIVSKELFDTIRTNRLADLEKVISNGLVHLFVYPGELKFLAFTFTDYNILISALKYNGEFDNKHFLCWGPSALEWGKELFEYYLNDSAPITEL